MLKGEIIVLTGGLGYLGSHFADAIHNAGGIVIVTDIKDFGEVDIDYEYYKMDITSESSIGNVIQAIHSKFKKIDAVVNNAYPRNTRYGEVLEKVDYQSFCENVNLHLGGYFIVNKLFAAFFSEQGFGNIINISSIYGISAPRFEIYNGTEMTMPVEYAAIKSSIIHLTKYFAKYYKGKNIRFNNISPGGILDDQPEDFVKKYNEHSLNKGMLERDDISGTLLFLLSSYSKYINGQNIVVDDGWSL